MPTIASTTTAWARALGEVAEEESNEEWVEELLERAKGAGNMIRVELETAKSDMPATVWADRARGFQIVFPKKSNSNIALASTMMAKFHGDLLKAFKPAGTVGGTTTSAAAVDEPWVDAGPDGESDIDAVSVMTPASTADRVMAMRSVAPLDRLPDINMIERPEDLCSRAPYHMIVRSSDRHIVVQGSHQASLELLSKYLKKWAKANMQFTNRVSQS